ncbi:MAG: hypothetical protein NC114_10605 [Ruminococcus flavefaciens]|nr:hypothetical protein [Ruminococcus flavefaciens]
MEITVTGNIHVADKVDVLRPSPVLKTLDGIPPDCHIGMGERGAGQGNDRNRQRLKREMGEDMKQIGDDHDVGLVLQEYGMDRPEYGVMVGSIGKTKLQILLRFCGFPTDGIFGVEQLKETEMKELGREAIWQNTHLLPP